MTSFNLTADSTTPQTLADGEFGTIQEDVRLATGADDAITADGDVLINVFGKVSSQDDGIEHGSSGFLSLVVGQRGSIGGGDSGVFSFSTDGARIENNGRISSTGDVAIDIEGQGPIRIINDGRIVGSGSFTYGIYTSSEGGETRITNNGTIEAEAVAIDQALGRIQLDNRGTIEGGVRSYDGSSNQDFIINRGTFIGEAFLGAQDDYFENRGTIDTLKLGGGNDVYWARGEGTGGLVEGGGGFDTLVSGKGDDLFEGGGAPDQFYMRKHGGDDQILDFHGKDVVNLSLLGLSSYREIRHDIHDTADGALLDLSDEFDFTLLLAGVSREDLKANDFLFESPVMTLF